MSDLQVVIGYLVGIVLFVFVRISWIIWKNRIAEYKHRKLKIGDIGLSILFGTIWIIVVPGVLFFLTMGAIVDFFESDFWDKEVF